MNIEDFQAAINEQDQGQNEQLWKQQVLQLLTEIRDLLKTQAESDKLEA